MLWATDLATESELLWDSWQIGCHVGWLCRNLHCSTWLQVTQSSDLTLLHHALSMLHISQFAPVIQRDGSSHQYVNLLNHVQIQHGSSSHPYSHTCWHSFDAYHLLQASCLTPLSTGVCFHSALSEYWIHSVLPICFTCQMLNQTDPFVSGSTLSCILY